MSHDHYDSIVSRHFFRRRARAKLAKVKAADLPSPHHAYWVTPAKRGPYRFYVVSVKA